MSDIKRKINSDLDDRMTLDWQGTRAFFYGLGYNDADIEKPRVGIMNTWNEINPGHIHQRHLADAVREGIIECGGLPFLFYGVNLCDCVDGGDYGSFFLMFPGGYDGYLSLNGRQGDNYVVEAALPDEDRYFRIATPRRAQVLFWFSGYYEKSRLPYMEEWKDVTKEVKKRRGEAD